MKFILMYDFLHEVGGLEKLMAIHAGYLKKEGYDVEILFSEINKEILGKNPIYRGFKVKEYGLFGKGLFKILFGLIGINKLEKMIKPEDIILSYSFPASFTIRNFKNKKISYLNHFPNFLYLPLNERIPWANDTKRKIALIFSFLFGWELKKIDTKLVNKSELLFANSEFTKKRLDKIYSIKGIVSYPPVSADIKPVIDKKILLRYNLGKNKFIFASGRIIPDKKIDWLIQSFSKIKDKNTLLLISGQISNKQKKILEKLAENLGIKKRVRFLGIIPKEDLIKLYSIADVYAFSAPKEDFGLVPAEAISCGTPCVIWGDGSGPCEIIKNNVNGIYAKPYDIEDFARKLEIAINKKWNINAILKSSNKFSEKEIRKEFIKAVNKITSANLK